MTTLVTAIVLCNLQNYIYSNCIPDELWLMPVSQCAVTDAGSIIRE